jgi:hypothetical protein
VVAEPAPPTRLELEITRKEASRIDGSLSAGAGDPVRFSGWLELISLIERLSGHDQARPSEEEHQ